MFSYCNNANAVAFVKKYYDDCVRLGRLVDVPPIYLLALAASETQYGMPGTFADIHNYFSMETKSDHPDIKYALDYKTASGTIKDKHPTKLAIYPSFYVCGLSFIDRYGSAIRGASTAEQFTEALKSAGFNSGDKKSGGTSTFLTDVPKVVTAVTARLACPG